MFLKFWIISTIICVVLFLSVLFSIYADLKREFTKEDLKEYKKKGKKKENEKYAWFVYVFFFTCPILNILFILIVGINYGEIKEKEFREIRLAIGKGTVVDAVSEALENVFNKRKGD